MSHPVTEAILGRRSIRDRFERTRIPHEILREIVLCGLAAPSSKNARPWSFHVVTDPTLLEELADAVETSEGASSYVPRDPATGRNRPDWPSTVAESADVLRHAATGIFVENRGAFSGGRRTLSEASGDNLRGSLVGYTFEVLGIGAAIQNMWLAANALGVQGAYMGDVVIAEAEIRSRLGMERDLVGVLALGYSDAPVDPSRVAYDVSDPSRVRWHHPDPTSHATSATDAGSS